MQNNIFFREPDLVDIETSIASLSLRPSGLVAVAVTDNIVRAAGGGEPADVARLAIDGALWPVLDVTKTEGLTWLSLDGAAQPAVGQRVSLSVDEPHRTRRRRLHTAVHIAIRSSANATSGFLVQDAVIDATAQYATVLAEAGPATEWFDRASATFFSVTEEGRSVVDSNLRSIDRAREAYGELFRLSGRHQLSGKVRVVVIEGFDANPCAGLHAPDTTIGDLTFGLEEAAGGLVRLSICLAD